MYHQYIDFRAAIAPTAYQVFAEKQSEIKVHLLIFYLNVKIRVSTLTPTLNFTQKEWNSIQIQILE